MRTKFVHFACIAAFLLLSGCAGKKVEDEAKNEVRPVETMYQEAAQSLDAGHNLEAAKLFDEVEREHPYSTWATRAQLMAAYAHYKALHYDDASLALDRFIQLHPGDPEVDYAYYLRALCYYEQISDVRRDQKMTELALDGLKQVVHRFPDSKYARDAQLKIDLTQDHLAGKEMEIGRYYLERGYYQSAIKRFQTVVDKYQTTTHVPEALHRLVEAYLSLGVRPEAEKAAAVLGHNFPGSQWYEDSYKLLDKDYAASNGSKEKSVFDRTIGRVF